MAIGGRISFRSHRGDSAVSCWRVRLRRMIAINQLQSNGAAADTYRTTRRVRLAVRWRKDEKIIDWTNTTWHHRSFLANVNSRSRSLYAVARPSVVCLSHSVVCLSSVTFVHPTQAVVISRNISTAFGTLAIRWHPQEILRRSSQGNPSSGVVKHNMGSQI